jgi:hypothetical protein
MWRLTGVTLGTLAVLGLTMSHGLLAQPEGKQLLCHVTEETDEPDVIIEVAPAAVPSHLEEHGDCLINSTDRSLIGQTCDATDADGDNTCDVQP